MTSTRALAAPSAGAPFEATTIERRALRDNDIRIDIAFAGICHSDIHQVREEWGPATFPMVPGHEIAGTVSEIGPAVTKFAVGDRVGVGCMVDSCGECELCKEGEQQYCAKGAVYTYNSKEYDGAVTYGGYSQQVVVTEGFVVRIPESIGLDEAAPLLCAGITTYSPLKRFGVRPGSKVAVVGLGGLGHVGVKIAKAMGAEVSVLSRSRSKEADATELGATHYYATGEKGVLDSLANTFDLVLNTVSADVDIEEYLRIVRPHGALVNVGLPMKPYVVAPFTLIGASRSLAGSNIGGIPETQEMLDFCGEHGIGATIETVSADEVTAAYERVVDGAVHYRVVIDTSTI